MTTLGIQLQKTGGRPAGFDYLRLGLAVAIIAFHTCIVCYGPSGEHALWTGPFGPLFFAIVPAFFALSGFLVAGSLWRNDLASFLTLRAIRIFPALVVEVVLSALILGPIFTTLPIGQYFSSNMFRQYFLNVLGDIHYYLPGVFNNLPLSGWINLQLWTVPYELQCYIGLSLLALARMHKRPMWYMGLVVSLCVAAVVHDVAGHHIYRGYGPPSGGFVILSFLVGVGLYNLRDRIPFSWSGLVIAAALAYFCLSHHPIIHLAILPIAYVTVFLGLCDPPRRFFVLGADYSYGMYLYGFPIQQTVSALLPHARIWYVNLVLSVILSACFAAFSWHLIEKPILGRKKGAVKFARGLALSHPALCRLFQWDGGVAARAAPAQMETT